MDEHAEFDEDRPVLNVVQIVVLNVFFCIGLLVTLRLDGLSWGASIGLAWIGGAVLTFATAAVVVFLHERTQRNVPETDGVRHEGPELVDDAITDALQVWEVDRLAEMEFSLNRAMSQPLTKSKPLSTDAMARMWDDDAKADVRENRSVGGDSRKTNVAEPDIKRLARR